ncbi:MAG: hypothetical protein IJ468_00380 [Lachnospiraceae bacterium]|nr:hypothetical protein [Lachnospiraceae bacterium]
MLLYIKHTKDEKVLDQLLSTEPRFQQIGRTATTVINTVTGSGLKFNTNPEVKNVCEAIEGMKRTARVKGRLEDVRNLMKTMNLTQEQAIAALQIPEDEQVRMQEIIAEMSAT